MTTSSPLVDEGLVSRVQCSCNAAYTGIRCLQDFNACSNFPCYGDITCTDHTAPSAGYTCGPCPSGLTGDGQKCYGWETIKIYDLIQWALNILL